MARFKRTACKSTGGKSIWKQNCKITATKPFPTPIGIKQPKEENHLFFQSQMQIKNLFKYKNNIVIVQKQMLFMKPGTLKKVKRGQSKKYHI
jgi:hypothetical protein